MYMIYFAVQQKLMQHCKTTILPIQIFLAATHLRKWEHNLKGRGCINGCMWFSKRGHEHESRICNYAVYFMLLKRHFLHIYGSACLPYILCNLKTVLFFYSCYSWTHKSTCIFERYYFWHIKCLWLISLMLNFIY